MTSSTPPNTDVLDALGLFSPRKGVPRGTTDVVMGRLFPEKRSDVPTDEERRKVVYDILMLYGILTDQEVQHATEEHGPEQEGWDELKGPAEQAAQAQGAAGVPPQEVALRRVAGAAFCIECFHKVEDHGTTLAEGCLFIGCKCTHYYIPDKE